MTSSPTGWSRIKDLFGLSYRASVARADPAPEPSQEQGTDLGFQIRPAVRELANGEQTTPEHPLGDALAAQSLPRDNSAQLALIRNLTNKGQYEQAAEICERHFGTQPDVRDEWNHPVYFKEMVRINVSMGRYGTAGDFVAKLQPLLDRQDPCIQLFYARKHAAMKDYASANLAYVTVLERAPNNEEAKDWLASHAKALESEESV